MNDEIEENNKIKEINISTKYMLYDSSRISYYKRK